MSSDFDSDNDSMSLGSNSLRSTRSTRSTRSASSSLGSQLGRLPGKHRPVRGSSLGSGGLDKHSCHSTSSRSSLGSARSSRYSQLSSGSADTTNGVLDPSLPPAFRVALRIEQQRRRSKNQKDDNSCLGSVASHCSTTANSTSCDWESLKDDSDDDDSSIDSADSFAAMDSDDDDDDDSIRIARTQLAKQELEMKAANKRRGGRGNSRFKSLSMEKSRGVLGTPLGLIVEEN